MLIVFTQDLTELFGASRVQETARQLDLLVFIGTNTNPTASLAHLVLPSAVYAEKDGTFTNFQRRMQRLTAAFAPWAESKPEWQILSDLAALLGVGITYPDAQAVFLELAQQEPAFRGLMAAQLKDYGALLRDGTGAPHTNQAQESKSHVG